MQDFNCAQMRALTAVASAKAGVRVQRPLRICLECRSKSKKCDKQLTHIVRVISRLFYCLVIHPLSRHAGRIDISHVNSNKEQSVFWKRKVHFLNNINEPGIAE